MFVLEPFFVLRQEGRQVKLAYDWGTRSEAPAVKTRVGVVQEMGFRAALPLPPLTIAVSLLKQIIQCVKALYSATVIPAIRWEVRYPLKLVSWQS